MIEVKKNESDAEYRRVYFQCVDATDGMTPETGEAGGQPQISTRGSAFADAGIGVLVEIGNGRYYAVLTQDAVNIADRSVIESRYKSANTAEAIGSTVQIKDPMADVLEGTITLKAALRVMLAALAGKTSGGGQNYRDVADAKNRIAASVDGFGDRTTVTIDGSD